MILIIEDDPDIAELVAHYLQRAGYETATVASGTDAVAHVRRESPELVLLDIMLPGQNGLEICRAMRADPGTAAIPIIMVTARGDETDRVSGLELGADDYITKPFSPKELVARVGALLRRLRRGAPAARTLRIGPITLDAEAHRVLDAGQEVPLTAKEFLLLQYLAQRPGRVLSRDLLLSDVWGYQYTGGTRTVDVHIRRLREKLPYLSTAIQTIKQFGYRLNAGGPAGDSGAGTDV
jgi:two-component system, OmpR family, alkaline phosphatase synthesis response regulator PhoP